MVQKRKATVNNKSSKVLFADIAVDSLEPDKTLPAKFRRMLRKLKLKQRVKDKSVGIKMHFGSNLGFSTIPPLFVKILVEELKTAGATRITAMDNNAADGKLRGYIPEILGCDVISTFGATKCYLYKERIGFKTLDYAEYGGEAVDCDFFIDLSHVKGHGDCGFGGALKNIAMGVVPFSTRRKIHQLEGGIVHDEEKCDLCFKCIKACPNDAIRYNKKTKKLSIFLHHCTYCQHCVMVCPEGALEMENRRFEDFSKGMAIVTARFLKKFAPEDVLFINFLTNITVFCDCWGMTTPSLVPDIGILASDDIVAVEAASLDMIKTEDLLPNGLPKKRELLDVDGHLFEKIHGKDPYLMIKYLKRMRAGSADYSIEEIK